MRRATGILAACVAFLAASSADLRGQGPGGPGESRGGPYSFGVLVGAKAGVDYLFDGYVVGAQAQILPDPWGRILLMPSAEKEFRQGIQDWQINADVAVMVTRGLYLGGGFAQRNTIYDETIGRETRSGHSIILGFREPPSPGRLGTQVEMRWSIISFMRPRTITLGMNYPLVLFR